MREIYGLFHVIKVFKPFKLKITELNPHNCTILHVDKVGEY